MSLCPTDWKGLCCCISSYLMSSSCWACCWYVFLMSLPSCIWIVVCFQSVSMALIPFRGGDFAIDILYLIMASDLCCLAEVCVCWGSLTVPTGLKPSVGWGARSCIYYQCVFLQVCCVNCGLCYMFMLPFGIEYRVCYNLHHSVISLCWHHTTYCEVPWTCQTGKDRYYVTQCLLELWCA